MDIPKLHDLRRGIAHLFYPRLCFGCRRPLLREEQVLCLACEAELPETGYHHLRENETAARFAGRLPFVHATSYAYFTNDGLLQHLVHGLKYMGRKEIGAYLGKNFANNLVMACYEGSLKNWLPSIDAVVPVPLHSRRLAKRGYNQSALICQGMAAILGKPSHENLLVRTRFTETQTSKTRLDRLANMQHAFHVPDVQAVKGKHILLCDDVLTTGATLEACALALLAAGDVKISIGTIGVAVS